MQEGAAAADIQCIEAHIRADAMHHDANTSEERSLQAGVIRIVPVRWRCGQGRALWPRGTFGAMGTGLRT